MLTFLYAVSEWNNEISNYLRNKYYNKEGVKSAKEAKALRPHSFPKCVVGSFRSGVGGW